MLVNNKYGLNRGDSSKGSWWQSPSKATDKNEHRVVSTIELFCDLVFVSYVAAITHNLAEHADVHGIIKFIILFSIGWLIWFNSSLYHDLHGNNDFKTRVITFAQMISIGFMSVFSHDVLRHSYMGFVISLSIIIFILGNLWRGTGIHDPSHKVFSKPYSIIYFATALFILASVFLDPYYRIYILGLTALLLLLPMVSNYLFANKELKKEFLQRVKLSNAFIERSNLYFIIVLGEIILGSLNGFGNSTLSLSNILTLLFNFIVAFGLWFNHFEFVGHIEHKETEGGYFVWLFSFFVETMMVAMIGSSVYENYSHFSMDLLLIATIVFFLVTIAHFSFNKSIANPNIDINTNQAKIIMSVAILLLCINFFDLNIEIKIAMYLLALYLPVIIALFKWIKKFNSDNE